MAIVATIASGSTVNRTPASGGEALWVLTELLVACGWTVQDASDGTTRAAGAVTHSGSGAGGMNNAAAWRRLREPGGAREIIVQRGTAETDARVKYSALDRFGGGSPSATQVPSATDEQILIGAGTDASPTYAQTWPTGGSYRLHVVGENAATRGVYGFWCFTSLLADQAIKTTWWHEPIGSGPSGDLDPVVIELRYDKPPTGGNYTSTTTGNSVRYWFKMNLTGESWVEGQAHSYENSGSTDLIPGQAHGQGTTGDPYDNRDGGYPVLYGRATSGATQGVKGFGSHIRWQGGELAYPTTFDDVDSDLWFVHVSDVLLPWPPGVQALA